MKIWLLVFGEGIILLRKYLDISRLLSKSPLSRKNVNEVQVLNSLQGSLEVQVFPWVEEQFFSLGGGFILFQPVVF